MAITVTVLPKATDFTAKKTVVADITFDSSYATGGMEPTGGWLKVLGLSTCDMATFESSDDTAAATGVMVMGKYNHTTDKVTLWNMSTHAELANGSVTTDVTLRGRFTGNAR